MSDDPHLSRDCNVAGMPVIGMLADLPCCDFQRGPDPLVFPSPPPVFPPPPELPCFEIVDIDAFIELDFDCSLLLSNCEVAVTPTAGNNQKPPDIFCDGATWYGDRFTFQSGTALVSLEAGSATAEVTVTAHYLNGNGEEMSVGPEVLVKTVSLKQVLVACEELESPEITAECSLTEVYDSVRGFPFDLAITAQPECGRFSVEPETVWVKNPCSPSRLPVTVHWKLDDEIVYSWKTYVEIEDAEVETECETTEEAFSPAPGINCVRYRLRCRNRYCDHTTEWAEQETLLCAGSISSYSISAPVGNYAYTYIDSYAPRAWELQASNDPVNDGWTLVDKRTGISSYSSTDPIRVFSLSEPSDEYRYWRLHITETVGSQTYTQYVGVGRWRLYSDRWGLDESDVWTAEEAAKLLPGGLAYLGRFDPTDPQTAKQISLFAASNNTPAPITCYATPVQSGSAAYPVFDGDYSTGGWISTSMTPTTADNMWVGIDYGRDVMVGSFELWPNPNTSTGYRQIKSFVLQASDDTLALNNAGKVWTTIATVTNNPENKANVIRYKIDTAPAPYRAYRVCIREFYTTASSQAYIAELKLFEYVDDFNPVGLFSRITAGMTGTLQFVGQNRTFNISAVDIICDSNARARIHDPDIQWSENFSVEGPARWRGHKEFPLNTLLDDYSIEMSGVDVHGNTIGDALFCFVEFYEAVRQTEFDTPISTRFAVEPKESIPVGSFHYLTDEPRYHCVMLEDFVFSRTDLAQVKLDPAIAVRVALETEHGSLRVGSLESVINTDCL